MMRKKKTTTMSDRQQALDKLQDAIAEYGKAREAWLDDDDTRLEPDSVLTHFIVVTNWDIYNPEGAFSKIELYGSDMAPFMRLGLIDAAAEVLDVTGDPS